MKISKVYTRTGDTGKTSLIGGHRVSKTHARIEAYGTVDELSADLGMLASFMKDGDDKQLIERIQRNLFTVCSHLATDQAKTIVASAYTLPDGEVKILEDEIDAINQGIPPLTSFLLPGGSHEAAICHVCRTVCRRAERRIFALAETDKVAPEVLEYINRLNDYLFVLARKLNFIDGVREKTWKTD